MAKFDMNGVEDMFDDMADMMADQEDIQEMMGRNFGVDCDEAALMDELGELDEEIIGDQLNEGLGLPSYIPQNNQPNPAAGNKNPAQANKPAADANKEDEAALEDMM